MPELEIESIYVSRYVKIGNETFYNLDRARQCKNLLQGLLLIKDAILSDAKSIGVEGNLNPIYFSLWINDLNPKDNPKNVLFYFEIPEFFRELPRNERLRISIDRRVIGKDFYFDWADGREHRYDYETGMKVLNKLIDALTPQQVKIDPNSPKGKYIKSLRANQNEIDKVCAEMRTRHDRPYRDRLEVKLSDLIKQRDAIINKGY